MLFGHIAILRGGILHSYRFSTERNHFGSLTVSTYLIHLVTGYAQIVETLSTVFPNNSFSEINSLIFDVNPIANLS